MNNVTQPLPRFDNDAENFDRTTRMPRLMLVPSDPDIQVEAAPPVTPEPAPLPVAELPVLDAASTGVPAEDVQPGRSLSGRLFGLALFAGTLAGLAWLAMQVYLVLTDGWVAPLHLSPQNDQIQSLRLTHQRYLDELARVDAEAARLSTELVAIDGAVTRLASLRGTSTEMMKWQAEHNRVVVGGLGSATRLLRRQRAQLETLHARQAALVQRVRGELAAGIVDRSLVDREEQTLDRLALEMIEIERQLGDTKLRRKESSVALEAFRAGIGDRAVTGVGQMPEVAAGDERDARIEIEIQRLEAEARGHRGLHAAAVAAVGRQRALLAEVEARPLYRAMKAATDVAFVPYDQLVAVQNGADVIACTWAIFGCTKVGRVGEVLPGEIVTEDPWGQRARGQYAVLELTDPDAIREKVLRIRR